MRSIGTTKGWARDWDWDWGWAWSWDQSWTYWRYIDEGSDTETLAKRLT